MSGSLFFTASDWLAGGGCRSPGSKTNLVAYLLPLHLLEERGGSVRCGDVTSSVERQNNRFACSEHIIWSMSLRPFSSFPLSLAQTFCACKSARTHLSGCALRHLCQGPEINVFHLSLTWLYLPQLLSGSVSENSELKARFICLHWLFVSFPAGSRQKYTIVAFKPQRNWI